MIGAPRLCDQVDASGFSQDGGENEGEPISTRSGKPVSCRWIDACCHSFRAALFVGHTGYCTFIHQRVHFMKTVTIDPVCGVLIFAGPVISCVTLPPKQMKPRGTLT